MPTLHPRHGAVLLGLAAGLLPLSLPAARAQNGTPGTPGTVGLTLPGSFTFNDPNASYVGTAGGAGGPGANGGFPIGFNGGTGGTGGTGVIATGANANITVLSGTFGGGAGGAGGAGGIARSGGINGGSTGGNGGDGFAATGAGTNITISGGNFEAGGGASVTRGVGGNDGNDLSTSAGETASVYGGFFEFEPLSGSGTNGNGSFGAAFALNGSNVTVYGTFLTQPGGTPIITPKTFTNSVGSFFGVLADNTGPGQSYIYTIANGGSLTLAPPPTVPEASTMVSFGLLLVLGGLAVAGRRGEAEESHPLTATAGGKTTTLTGPL